jgi:hypothetical protein
MSVIVQIISTVEIAQKTEKQAIDIMMYTRDYPYYSNRYPRQTNPARIEKPTQNNSGTNTTTFIQLRQNLPQENTWQTSPVI